MKPDWPTHSPFCAFLFAGAVGLIVLLPADLAAQPVGKPGPPGQGQPWVLPQPQQPHRSPTTPVGGAFPALICIAFAIWAIQLKLQQEEEEEVTPLSADSTTGFEYKIIRSSMGAFKKPDKLKAMLEEEARAGWELFEKLDDCRVRLRRSVAARQRDGDLNQDPYRTKYAGGDARIFLIVVLSILALIAIVGGVALGLSMNK
jgi:hypothetical protein